MSLSAGANGPVAIQLREILMSKHRSTASNDCAKRRTYNRDRDLPRLVALWPQELADVTPAGRHRLLLMLRRALREERRRGIAGHWCYDLARHAGLLAAYRHEAAAYRELLGYANPDRALSFSRAGFPDPFSSPAASGRPHSSEPPSGNRAPGSISHGIHRATACNGSADAASAT